MSARHPRQRLLDGFCRLHRALVLTYPSRFQQEFRDELLITYRDDAGARLREAGPAPTLSLLVDTLGDWLRTLASARRDASTSVLCLAGRDTRVAAYAGDQTVALLLASLGIVLMLSGWMQWVRHEAAFFSHYTYREIALGSGSRRARILVERTTAARSSQEPGASSVEPAR